MDAQRAREIANSPVMAHVTYQGTPIYIQNVEEENGTARVYPLAEPENERDVYLSDLNE